MLLQHIFERIQEVTPHHYISRVGDIFRVYQHNFNGVTLTDNVRVQPVIRMWSNKGRIASAVSPKVIDLKLSDGCEVMTAAQAYEIYQLQRGAMKKLAGDAAESPNYIRQVNDIDS